MIAGHYCDIYSYFHGEMEFLQFLRTCMSQETGSHVSLLYQTLYISVFSYM